MFKNVCRVASRASSDRRCDCEEEGGKLMDRNIHTVVERIKALIPDSYALSAHVNASLDNILDSAKYTAPELMYARWIQVSTVLQNNLPQPTPDAPQWALEIRDVFAGIRK